MAMFTIRDVDPEVWRKFQERQRADAIPSRTLGRRLLEIYARCGIKPLEELADRLDPPRRPGSSNKS